MPGLAIPLNKVTTVMGGDAGFTTKYEEYAAANQDTVREFFANFWAAQGFTPGTGHTLNGVKLPLFREGTIGEVSVSIQADSGGDPDGTDLSLATFPGMDLPLTSAVKLISLPAVTLTVSTLYHIVVRLAGGDGSNSINWDEDSSSPTYAGGSRNDSSNSGSTWTPNTGSDFIFEEWGFV